MKKIFILFNVVFFNSSFFAQITWSGLGTGNNFTTPGNWVGGVVPVSTDNVIFDGTGTKNCDFDVDIQVVNFSINSGYTGTIDALASLPIITGNFSQAAGTFISTSDLTSNAGLIIGGNIAFTGGTFNHNSGLVTLGVTDAVVTTITGAIVFNRLDIIPSGLGGGQRTLDFGTTTTNILNLNGGARLFAYQNNVTITGALTIGGTAVTVPTGNSGTFTFSGSGPITITGASNSTRNRLPNLVFNTSGTISMSSNVNVQGNWTGTAGTLNAGSSTVNMYGTSNSISGTAAAFQNLTIQSGASISLPAAEVRLGGSLTRTGTLNFSSAGSIGFNGTAAQTASLSGASLLAITCYSSSSTRAITITGPVDITDSLKLGNNVLFTINSGLTLKATSAKKARFALLGTSASITGNVTVETYIPNSVSDWRMLGISGVTGQTLANWDTYPGNPNGLPMTCEGCTFGTMGIGSYFESVQSWEETKSGYDTSITSASALSPGKGFWVYVGNTAHTEITLSNTGALVTGNVAVAVTKTDFFADPLLDNFNLVANPYACPISWDRVKASNNARLAGAIYAYGQSGDVSYNSGSGGTSGDISTGAIPAGQGFYVEANNGGNINFTEAHKIFDNTGSISKPASTLQNFRLKIAGSADEDDALINFNSNATHFFDGDYDAHKLFSSPGYIGYPGVYDKYTTISTKDPFNWDYSIQSIPPLTNSLSIPVLARVSASGSYTISATDFQNFSSCVGLLDKTTNITHDLRQSDYVFTISDSTAAPRFELMLCRDESIPLAGIAQTNLSGGSILISQNEEGAVVKTAFPQSTKAIISLYNIVGQKLMGDVMVEGTATVTNLNINLHNQVVLIRVVTDKEISTKKMVLH